MSEELKPCPFCGGKPRLDQRVTQSLWNSSDATFSNVTCDECDVTGQDFCDDPSGKEAIEWWNRRAQPAEADGMLADRMRAAGMMTVEEMLAGAPLDGFIRHAGVKDLDTYGQWLDMKCREFLTMQAKRDLDKDPEDEMYEWVLAHAAVFQEARINFKAARDAHLAALSAVTAERDALRYRLEAADEWATIASEQLKERDQLRAEVEKHVPLYEAVERACGELPEGWSIEICIERGAGWVELHDEDGCKVEHFPTNNERIDYTVIDALEAAMAAKEG